MLYDKYSRAVHWYAATRAGESVADDVMSQTFLAAFEGRESFDHQWEDARPWPKLSAAVRKLSAADREMPVAPCLGGPDL